MTKPDPVEAIMALADRYAEAWASRERIASKEGKQNARARGNEYRAALDAARASP